MDTVFSTNNIKNSILPFYDLMDATVEIIKFKNTDKQRVVYKVTNNNKSYALKKVYYSLEDLLYVYSAMEWLSRNNINVPKFIHTNTSGRYVEYNNMLFVLTPWIAGYKCDFDNPTHLFNSCTTLGKMHARSTNFIPIIGSSNRESLGDYYIYALKHFEQFIKCSAFAYINQDKFSKKFLSTYDNNLKLAELSLYIASSINNNNLSISLCHGDYVNKNILFDKNNETYIIDFDKCKKDYCAHDLSYFLRRLLKRDNTNWNVELTTSLIQYYNSEKKLTTDDIKYIISYLIFPQKCLKIAKDYYKALENKKEIDINLYISLLNKCNKNLTNQIIFSKEIYKKFKSSHWRLI